MLEMVLAMKGMIFILLLLGVVGISFGTWGLETVAGRAAFEEMAGMIPYFACVAGYAAIALAAFIAAIRFLGNRSAQG